MNERFKLYHNIWLVFFSKGIFNSEKLDETRMRGSANDLWKVFSFHWNSIDLNKNQNMHNNIKFDGLWKYVVTFHKICSIDENRGQRLVFPGGSNWKIHHFSSNSYPFTSIGPRKINFIPVYFSPMYRNNIMRTLVPLVSLAVFSPCSPFSLFSSFTLFGVFTWWMWLVGWLVCYLQVRVKVSVLEMSPSLSN